jgi:hypothetical protein
LQPLLKRRAVATPSGLSPSRLLKKSLVSRLSV